MATYAEVINEKIDSVPSAVAREAILEASIIRVNAKRIKELEIIASRLETELVDCSRSIEQLRERSREATSRIYNACVDSVEPDADAKLY